MNLSDAASYFDQSAIQDAYAPGATIFKAQFGLFDGSTRDGMTVRRRIMSVAPSVSLPARKTILTSDSKVMLIGGNQEDYMQGSVIRRKHIVQYTDGLAQVRSAANVIGSVAGTDVYATKYWVKELKETEFSSDRFGVYDVYFADNETVTSGFVVSLGGKYYRVMSKKDSAGGFLVAETAELPLDNIVSITYTPKTAYVAGTDSYGTGTPVVANALWEYFKTNFKYYQDKQFRYEAGDVLVTVRATDIATPKVGDTLVILSRTMVVIAVADDGNGAWELHCRNE